jgi:hypothetical protein
MGNHTHRRQQKCEVAKFTYAYFPHFGDSTQGLHAARGYFNGEDILACEEAGITVTLPKPMTSNSKAEGRFGKQDFRYVAEEDVYIVPRVKSSPTTTRTRKMGWSCAVTAPTPARAAPSSKAAPLATSDGDEVGLANKAD